MSRDLADDDDDEEQVKVEVDGLLPAFDIDALYSRNSGDIEMVAMNGGVAVRGTAAAAAPSSASRGGIFKRSGEWLKSLLVRGDSRVREAAHRFYDSSWKAIKATFVSAETEEACRQIWKILMGLYQDLRPVDAATGLLLMSSYYMRFPRRVPEKTRRLCTAEDGEVLSRAVDLCRHAMASYGWKAVCGFMTHVVETSSIVPASTVAPILALDDEAANVAALCQHTKISQGDILETKWTSKPFSPGHYVCVDGRLKAAVVSIRGTWGVKDSVADLLATARPWSFRGATGFVHEGMMTCALRKVEELEPILAKVMLEGDDREHNTVLLTGHSLGGGTATLLSLLLADRHPEWNVECWAFAPSATMTRELAESPEIKRIVRSFVFRDDAVPRLSYGSADLLKKTMLMLLSQSQSTAQRLFQWIASGNVLGDTVTKYVESKLGVKAEVDLERALCEARAQRGSGDTFMCPAGRVFHLLPIDPSPPSTPTPSPTPTPTPTPTPLACSLPDTSRTVVLVPCTPRRSKFSAGRVGYEAHEIGDLSFFDEIVVSGNMFLDHLPHKYEFAVSGAAEEITGVHRDDVETIQIRSGLLRVLRPPTSSPKADIELLDMVQHSSPPTIPPSAVDEASRLLPPEIAVLLPRTD